MNKKTIKKNVRSFPLSAREAFGRWCSCSRDWFTNAESNNSASTLASSFTIFTNELKSAVDRIFQSKVIKIHDSDSPWMYPGCQRFSCKGSCVKILKQLFASGSVIIGEYSPRLRLGEYSPIITSPSANNC